MASPLRPAGAAQTRVEMLLIRTFGALRAIQLAIGAPVLAGDVLDGRPSFVVIVGAYAVAVGWSATLYAVAVRAGRVRVMWIAVDMGLAVLWLVAMPQACDASCTVGWTAWVVPPAMGSAILAAVFAPLRVALPMVLVVASALVAGAWLHKSGTSGTFGETAVNAYFLLGFAALAWFFSALLRRSAGEVEEATGQAIEARGREAAARARFDERTRQYDVLHHTVLSTLSKIARGGLDHRAAEVRALCARDADFLRGLLTGAADESPGDLAAALASVVRDKQALGLRVHSQFHALPGDLPAAVSTMLVGAAREALTNVTKHAGANEAWLTAVGDGDGVHLSVVDRGVGFEPDQATAGRGLVRELRHGVIETGGSVTVTSSPGDGTAVEVRWAP